MNCLLKLKTVNALALSVVRASETRNQNRWIAVAAIWLSMAGGPSNANADDVVLQNATATFSQTAFGGQPVGEAIDGILSNNDGWAIFDTVSGTNPQTAVFETVIDTGSPGGVNLEFQLHQLFTITAIEHNIGRFRLSVTADDRSEFADGLASGGDVTANWTVLTPYCALSTGGAALSVLGDGSILASGPNPSTSVYNIFAFAPFGDITGFRLEVLDDSSLPTNGPGRAFNGNFVLTEFLVNTFDVLLGDVNGDCVVSLLDVAPFVSLVTSGGFQAEGDINGDGVVNLLDVSPFVELLTN